MSEPEAFFELAALAFLLCERPMSAKANCGRKRMHTLQSHSASPACLTLIGCIFTFLLGFSVTGAYLFIAEVDVGNACYHRLN